MQDVSKFTSSTSFQAQFSHSGHDYFVDVRVPDLTQNERHCWGDWGPMHTIQLKRDQPIQLVYRCSDRSLSSEYKLRVKSVELNSPMFAKERDKHPLCLEFVDQPRALRFLAYFDHEGQVNRVEVELVHPDYEIDELLFPQDRYEAVRESRAQMSA